MKLADSLSPELLGRETIQLAVVAALSVVVLVFAPRWLQVVAGVVDVLIAVACGAGLVVAARVARGSRALALYGLATAVFVVLAVLNLLG